MMLEELVDDLKEIEGRNIFFLFSSLMSTLRRYPTNYLNIISWRWKIGGLW